MKCTLCRLRHKVHYADVRIMPTWSVSALVADVEGLLKSA
jgi:hypothetical protein